MNEYTDFGRRESCGCGRDEYGYEEFRCPDMPPEPHCERCCDMPSPRRCCQPPVRSCGGCSDAMAIAAIFAVMCLTCR